MIASYVDLHASIPRPNGGLVYKRVAAKTGSEWLIPVNIPNAADYVHFVPTPEDQKSSQGYGGSTLTFKLEDGGELRVRGPWHGNAGSLFSDTGVDVRDLHYTRCAIGRSASKGQWMTADELLYIDGAAVLGQFERGETLARQIANLRNEPVYLVVASSGGGFARMVKPGEA